MKSELTIIYEDAVSAGINLAERLIENQVPTGGLEIELRQEAATAVDTAHTEVGRTIAVRRLGMVRGFREVVR